MKNLFGKLDRQFGRWLAVMDDQLQEPVLRAISGEVFVHGATLQEGNTQQHMEEVSVEPPMNPGMQVEVSAPDVQKKSTYDGKLICPPLVPGVDGA